MKIFDCDMIERYKLCHVIIADCVDKIRCFLQYFIGIFLDDYLKESPTNSQRNNLAKFFYVIMDKTCNKNIHHLMKYSIYSTSTIRHRNGNKSHANILK